MTDQWLVRTSKNFIAGPYSKAQVIQLIRDGQLSFEDEVCQANHYWIFLHEHEEVARQLGIQMPKSAKGDDEVTETQTETLSTDASQLADLGPEMESEHTTAIVRGGSAGSARSQSSHMAASAASGTGSGAHGHAHAAQSSGGAAMSGNEHGSVMSRPAMSAGAQGGGLYPRVPETASGSRPWTEKLAIWRTFAWLLIVIACVIVFIVLRVLRMTHETG